MSGHNKWSKVKYKKAVTDSIKSKVYSKYNKLITAAVKEAGGDLGSAAVKSAIEQAKANNVPKDNIERAIKRASEKDAAQLQEVLYEGFGPGGIGVLVKAVTDNTNRTVSEVKAIFTKLGGTFASSGAVSWGFTKNAEGHWEANDGTEIELAEGDQDKLEKMTEAFEESDDVIGIYHNCKI